MLWKWLQMLSSSSFKPFFLWEQIYLCFWCCFPMFPSGDWLLSPMFYLQSIFSRGQKKNYIRSSQPHLIILKTFLSQFLLRFVKQNDSFQEKGAACVRALSTETIKQRCLNNEPFVECWFQNPCEKRPHPFLVMKQLIKVCNGGLCNNIYNTE